MSNYLDESKKNDWWKPGLLLFGKLSSWIVAPVLIGTILGKYLDKKFNTEPIMLMSVVGFCFLISIYGLIKETMSEYKKIEKEVTDKKIQDKDKS
ncbi:AtpZ/AtpI family protein [Candidatus Parcubacteria bacterium]|nr:AtpZ/AtpI family protein [Candidatus Parcubacteria bacterium]